MNQAGFKKNSKKDTKRRDLLLTVPGSGKAENRENGGPFFTDKSKSRLGSRRPLTGNLKIKGRVVPSVNRKRQNQGGGRAVH